MHHEPEFEETTCSQKKKNTGSSQSEGSSFGVGEEQINACPGAFYSFGEPYFMSA